jgi:hypothetical protein
LEGIKFSKTDNSVVAGTAVAASDSPDGLSLDEIASATGLSWRTVHTVLQTSLLVASSISSARVKKERSSSCSVDGETF